MRRLLPLLLLVACDGAQDVAYHGELELAFSTQLLFGLESQGSVAPFELALIWGSADGTRVARVDPVAFACNVGAECRVEVFSRPPATALRAARRGQWALGEIVAFSDADRDGRWDPNESNGAGEGILGRIAFVVSSPDGASDDRFQQTIPRGMRLVDLMAPCVAAEAAGEQRFVIAPDADQRASHLKSAALASYVGGEPHYFDPLCAERYLAAPVLSCPVFDVVRWLCRREDPDAEVCARCEYQVFPPNAEPFACGEWRSRWNTHLLDPSLHRLNPEVLAEARLCDAREPAVDDACEQTCACDKRHSYCRDVEERPPLDCAQERDACLVF